MSMTIITDYDPEFSYNPSDQRVWEEDLDGFVPAKIFDAHMHLWSDRFIEPDGSGPSAYVEVDMAGMVEINRQIFPGRDMAYLALCTPRLNIDVDGHNRWVAQELKPYKNARAHRLVQPSCKVEDIRADVAAHGFQGLKPYRIYSVTGDRNECRIHEFLTHEQMELANELGLWVTMHLSRHDGCADELNLKDLAEYTGKRYPRIKWILAHCARSFTYWPIRQAIDRLRDMPNIWYDVSAVTDVMPHYTLYKKEDHRRILFGSDNLLGCGFHGKYAATGRFWYQIGTVKTANGVAPSHTDAQPILCIYDQLLCMKHAAELAELSPSQIEDIFYHNAASAFGLDRS